MSFDDSDDDLNRSYDVFIDRHPPTEARVGSIHCGDVYVQLDDQLEGRAVYISTSNTRWVSWNPPDILGVAVLGVTLYATPCKMQGLQYVMSEEQARQVPADVPYDISILARLIGIDCKYASFMKEPLTGSKRSVTDVVTSSPRRNKLRAQKDIDVHNSKGKQKATIEDVPLAPRPELSKTMMSPTIDESTDMDWRAETVPITMQCVPTTSGPSNPSNIEVDNTDNGDEDDSKVKRTSALLISSG